MPSSRGNNLRLANFLRIVMQIEFHRFQNRAFLTASSSPSPFAEPNHSCSACLVIWTKAIVGYDQRVYKALSSSRGDIKEKKDQRRTEREVKEDKKVLN